ncbi:hypothetical protein OPV22_002109 [Ensete ventricosum]|uniref:Uncharacterized protein n=1 Tax=Ensete ventricosum TaxID=4639 RepID=A0AAV8RX19_ENSVE|nr:hypothetical protein OPV22_002109 [Ensete ventricosum]
MAFLNRCGGAHYDQHLDAEVTLQETPSKLKIASSSQQDAPGRLRGTNSHCEPHSSSEELDLIRYLLILPREVIHFGRFYVASGHTNLSSRLQYTAEEIYGQPRQVGSSCHLAAVDPHQGWILLRPVKKWMSVPDNVIDVLTEGKVARGLVRTAYCASVKDEMEGSLHLNWTLVDHLEILYSQGWKDSHLFMV